MNFRILKGFLETLWGPNFKNLFFTPFCYPVTVKAYPKSDARRHERDHPFLVPVRSKKNSSSGIHSR